MRPTLPALIFLALSGAPLRAQAPQQCGRCHSSREFLLQVAREGRVGDDLVVTRANLTGGPHANAACASCHRGVQSYPHEPLSARTVECRRCHAAVDSAWRRGVHRPATPDSAAASCVDCHGGHEVARSGFLPTAEGRALMRAACLRCHELAVRTAGLDVHADSIACTQCHGDHDMRPVPDHATRFIDVALARACSQCHRDVAATYWRDSHGAAASRQAAGEVPIGPEPAATCVSCHGEHGIRRAADPAWRFAVADACMRCHEDYGNTFRDSYHGQASRVGSLEAAECADCHTAHSVLPRTDSSSSVSPANRLATCRNCHTGASANFAGYQPHADPTDRAGNPLLFYVWAFMTTVLFGTMVVWGTHTLLWYRRSWQDRKARLAAAPRRSARPRVPMDAALRGHGPFVWRFGAVFRIIHALIVATFFVLVITGLPLRFSCAAWAPGLARLLGGVETAGLIHRIAGGFVFGYFALYAAHVTLRLVRARDLRAAFTGPDSILLSMRDARDIVAMVKWFLRKGPRPRFGRYSYMEKFDYFAELWGVGVIGFTGLMLWMPKLFAHIFPGILFNVAIIVHSYEAMIATAFIFMIHFFNVHLRPDKWPLDAVMLHGRATMHYMEEEHPELAERLKPQIEGMPPSARAVTDAPAPPPSGAMSVFAAVTGLVLLGVGLGLIGLILWGSLC